MHVEGMHLFTFIFWKYRYTCYTSIYIVIIGLILPGQITLFIVNSLVATDITTNVMAHHIISPLEE